ncbi:outer membrane beta-barrel protein [Ahniella affigens]|nr:outer membrane beta-barrel protein [Ahniella affigens]
MKRVILGALLALPLSAMASEDLSYSYLGLGATYADPNGFSGENGYGAEASGAFHDNWHVFGSFQTYEFGDGVGAVDVDQWNIGLGYNVGLTDNMDLVAGVSYERAEVDYNDGIFTGSTGEDGYGVRVGVRNAFNAHFEGAAGLKYTNFDGSNSTSVYVSGQYKFNDTWGITGEVEANDDGHTIFLGPRLSF